MILAETDLSAPELSCEGQHQFSLRARSVCALVVRLLGRFQTGTEVWKVLVEVTPSGVPNYPIRVQMGVAMVRVAGEATQLLDEKNELIEHTVSDWLLAGLTIAAREYGWPIAIFQDAVRRAREIHFSNVWIWKKRRRLDRKRSAAIVIEHTPLCAKIIAVVYDNKGNELARQTLAEEKPDEFIFMHGLGRVEWENQTTLGLYTGRDRCWARIDTSGPEITVVQDRAGG